MKEQLEEWFLQHRRYVDQIEEHGMIESHRDRIAGGLSMLEDKLRELLLEDTPVHERPWREDEKSDPNYGRTCACGAAIRAGGRLNHFCEYTGGVAKQTKDVHTEHCCERHGCKYNDSSCSVEYGEKKQSFPCEQCDDEASDPVRSALQAFVDDFEVDDMWRDEESHPNWCWARLSALYKKAKAALNE